MGKILNVILLLSMVSAPVTVLAAGQCTSFDQQLAQARFEYGGQTTGGFAAAQQGTQADPGIEKIKSVIASAKSAGCNIGGEEWWPQDYLLNDGTITNSEYTPAAPMEKNVVDNPTYDTDLKGKPTDSEGVTMPIPKPNKPEATPLPNKKTNGASTNAAKPKPAANNTGGGGGGGVAAGSGTAVDPLEGASECGKIAATYGDYLTGLKGAEQPTYKPGCAGTNADNTPRTTPDNSGQACSGNQFGQFGLVQAAYNNSAQASNVGALLGATPGTVSNTPGLVSSMNSANGFGGGCKLANYKNCGQAGDIVMVQSNSSSTQTDPYDIYMIYAGDGTFYRVTNSTNGAIKKSALPPEYASMSYATVRQPCQ